MTRARNPDAQGVLRTWWQPQDEIAFKKLVDRLASQYDAFEPLPGLHCERAAHPG